MKHYNTEVINQKLVRDVKDFIEQDLFQALRNRVEDLLPADMADLIEHLKPGERLSFFKLLETKKAADVLIEIEASVQEQIVSSFDNARILDIVDKLDSDNAADIIGFLPAERIKKIVTEGGEKLSPDVVKLLSYDRDTAGGIMALEFVAVKDSSTTKDAIEKIREKREDLKKLYHIWVVDDHERLAGAVSLKDLLLEPEGRKLKEIMNSKVISAGVHMDQEKVARLFHRYDMVDIPVLDEKHRLVGYITHDDIIDVIHEEAHEDLSMMAGISGQKIREESTLKIFRARLPWLIAGLFGGILAAIMINQFEATLKQVIALSFFFPVIMAMGGNIGTQTTAVVLSGLATGDIRSINIARRFWLETRVALLNGIVCGILLGFTVGFWVSDYALGVIVTLAMILIILISGIVGCATPFVLKKLNFDPSLASGPFVTTSNDILGLLIYLGLVTFFLHAGFISL